MSGQSREHILSQIADLHSSAPLPDWDADDVTTAPEVEALWAMYTERLTALGGEMKGREHVLSLADRKCFVDFDAPAWAKALQNCDDIWTADVGITAADFAIAVSGTLIIRGEAGRSRLASVVPPLHVAVVASSAISASLEVAFQRMAALAPGRTQRSIVMITGPSRTADIEGVLVRGVHGPKEIWVVRE